MKVLLLTNYEPDAQFSMLAFGQALVCATEGKADWIVLVPQNRSGSLTVSWGRKWLGYIDKYILFRTQLRKAAKDVDLVHIVDHSNAVYVPWLKGKPHVVTCHDLLPHRAVRGEFPGWTVGPTGRILQKWIASGIRKTQCLACVSEATRQDAIRVLGVQPERTTVIRNGFYKPVLRFERDEARDILGDKAPESFLLHVGGNQPYKNRPGVVRTYAAWQRRTNAKTDLILAGKEPPESLRELVRQLGIETRVHFWVGASDKEIQALYHSADGLLFLSLAEGFGLPVLEAMACGCPVVTSNRAPMTEVGGNVPLYVDPENEETAAEAIQAWWPSRRDRVEEGLARTAEFSTQKMVDNYVELYRKVLDGWP